MLIGLSKIAQAVQGDASGNFSQVLSQIVQYGSTPLNGTFEITSLADARRYIFLLAMRGRPGISVAEANEVAQLLESWRVAFNAYRATLDDDTLKKMSRAFALVDIHRLYLGINVWAGLLQDSEKSLPCDQWNAEFSEIVDLAVIAAGLDGQDKVSTGHPVFYNEIGLVPALHFVCARCQNPQVRQRALKILEANQIQEGFLNSLSAADSARRIILHEERGSAAASERKYRAKKKTHVLDWNVLPEVAHLSSNG